MWAIKTNDIYMLHAVIFENLIGALMLSEVKYLQGTTSGAWVIFNIVSTLLIGGAVGWGYSRHRAHLKSRLESVPAPEQTKPDPTSPAA